MPKEHPKVGKIIASHSPNFKDRKIFSNLINILKRFSHIKTIFIYVSKKDEPDTLSLIQKFLDTKMKVIVPVTDEKAHRIIPVRLTSMNDLVTGSFGVLEPKKAKEFDQSMIDVFIVPGTKFDLRLNRKGHGLGYFDRFLEEVKGRKPIIGLTYEKNIVEALPVNDWDVPMDILISEKRIVMDN